MTPAILASSTCHVITLTDVSRVAVARSVPLTRTATQKPVNACVKSASKDYNVTDACRDIMALTLAAYRATVMLMVLDAAND